MSNLDWLTPLGFIGLLGIAILILIYLIKPNFQQKIVSSTYVWKLSLKYRKKRIPISKLRNIILIICQVLVVCICAFVLAQPYLAGADAVVYPERVIVIDASANMRAANAGTASRFEKSVEMAKELSRSITSEENGRISVILAGYAPEKTNEPERLDTRVVIRRSTSISDIEDALNSLIAPDLACTYGTAEINMAMSLAESILRESTGASIVLYSSTEFVDKNDVEVIDPDGDEKLFNAAILDVEAVYEDGNYTFYVDLGVYNALSVEVELELVINGVYDYNSEADESEKMLDNIRVERTVRCTNGIVVSEIFDEFKYEDGSELLIRSYDNVEVRISNQDSFDDDNRFYLYGGRKQKLLFQYQSTMKNVFYNYALLALSSNSYIQKYWDITIEDKPNGSDFVTKGYDFYIFENRIPPELPKDGVVFLANPNFRANMGIDLLFEETERKVPNLDTDQYNPLDKWLVSSNVDHTIMQHVKLDELFVTKYRKVISQSGYDVLLRRADNDDALLLVRNDKDLKIMVAAFSHNYSNLAILKQFPAIMINAFMYFFPQTIDGNVFEIGAQTTVNPRMGSATLEMQGGITEDIEGITDIKMLRPGRYTITQKLLGGEREQVDSFFVRVPVEQSNFIRKVDKIQQPYVQSARKELDVFLLFYFAATLVGLLFIEWILQSRESF